MNGNGTRWDAFTPWELDALDEFFKSFASCRDYCADIQKLAREIAVAADARRRDKQ